MIKDYFIKIGNKGYKLLPFTSPKVQDQIYTSFATKEETNGWKVLQERAKNSDPKIWIEVAYIMLIDKVDFPKYEDFYEAVSENQESRQNLLSVVNAAVNDRKEEIDQDKSAKKKIIRMTILGATLFYALLLYLASALGLVSLNI